MLLPMFVMIMWICIILLYALFHRIRGVQTGKIKAWYFKTFSGAEAPDWTLRQNRQIMNLFEVPPLFMITCLTVIVLNIEDWTFQLLAWGFVGFRVVHSIIHLSFNHVIARLVSFLVSTLCLAVMWLRIVSMAT